MKSCRSERERRFGRRAAADDPLRLPARRRAWCASGFGGYTILEMLIAMSLLVPLGGGLGTLLRQSISIWSTAENRGRVYEEARAGLDPLADDLRPPAIPSHAARGGGR